MFNQSIINHANKWHLFTISGRNIRYRWIRKDGIAENPLYKFPQYKEIDEECIKVSKN